jgi:hypothetical protein
MPLGTHHIDERDRELLIVTEIPEGRTFPPTYGLHLSKKNYVASLSGETGRRGALANNKTGTRDSAFGVNALFSNTVGVDNTVSGAVDS